MPRDSAAGPQLVAHLPHHRGPLLGQRRLEIAQAVDAAQGRIETRAHARLGRIELAGDRLAEAARVGHLVDDEGVDLVELAAGDLDADVVEIEAAGAVVDELDPVGVDEAEGQLEIEPRLGLHRLDLAEAHDDRLLARIDDEERVVEHDQDDDGDDADEDRETIVHLLPPLACALLRPALQAAADTARRSGRCPSGR